IKEIQQSSEERFEQTLELAKKIALKKAEIYKESAKEIYESINTHLEAILREGKEGQQQSYQDLINKISKTDKPKKEHKKYLITEIKNSENKKEQIIELKLMNPTKKTFEESIDELKETVLDQLKKRESFEEKDQYNYYTEAIKLKWTIGYQDTTDQIAKQFSEAKTYHDWSKIIEDKLIDNYDYIPTEYKSRRIYYYELIKQKNCIRSQEIGSCDNCIITGRFCKVELKERSTREKEKLPRKKLEPTYKTERRNQEFLESVKLQQKTIQNCKHCLERHKE
ncbi:17594_t:CDS:2, partial [Cetraspora pellucida]